MNGTTRWFPYLLLAPALVYIALFFGYPILYNLFLGFTSMNAQDLIAGTFRWNGVANYAELGRDPVFLKALRNSLLFTLFSIMFQFDIGFALAVLLNRKGAVFGVLRAALLTPWLAPLVASASVWVWLMSGSNGIINYLLIKLGFVEMPVAWLSDPATSLIGTIIVNIWIGIPFCMVLLHAGLQSIPNDLYEAAALDGANPATRVLKITLPMLKDVSAIVILLGIVYGIRIFDLVWVLTKGGPANASQVLGTYAYDRSFVANKFGIGASAANVMLIISVGASLVYLRFAKSTE